METTNSSGGNWLNRNKWIAIVLVAVVVIVIGSTLSACNQNTAAENMQGTAAKPAVVAEQQQNTTAPSGQSQNTALVSQQSIGKPMPSMILSKLEGNFRCQNKDVTVQGMVIGNVVVTRNCRVLLNGMISGDVDVETGGRLDLNGVVGGSVTNKGGKISVHGTIGGTLVKGGGETLFDPQAKVTNTY